MVSSGHVDSRKIYSPNLLSLASFARFSFEGSKELIATVKRLFIVFLTHSICCGLLIWLINYTLIHEGLFYEYFKGKIDNTRIAELVGRSPSGEAWEYLAIPFFFFAKFNALAIIFSCGAFLNNREISYSSFFETALYSDFILLAPLFLRLVWFNLLYIDYTLEDLHNFFPLSLYSILDTGTIDHWLAYPTQLLNVFELAYWIVLALQLEEVLEKPFAESLGFVAKTYGVGLAVWVLVVMFLTVSIS
jgi:hypothetical protein